MDKHAAVIGIEGMTCGSCVQTIESNVGKIPGVLSIQVDLSDKEASLVVDPSVVTMNNILDKFNSMGFVATQKKTPKDKTSQGCLSLDSSSHGATGHQSDLASIFSGAGAGDLNRGKWPAARKPKAAIGDVENGSRQNGVVPRKPKAAIGVAEGGSRQNGVVPRKPKAAIGVAEGGSSENGVVPRKPKAAIGVAEGGSRQNGVVPRKSKAAIGVAEGGSSENGAVPRKPKAVAGGVDVGSRKIGLVPRKPKAATNGVEGASSQNEVVPINIKGKGELAEKPEIAERKKKALSTKPAYLDSPDIHPVVEKKYTVVVYDVETSSLSNAGEIIQLSATSVHGSFNAYILPLAEISFYASQVHKITKFDGGLFHEGTRVPAKSKKEAWIDFIRFCENISPVLLVGHNVKFDARCTLNELARMNMTENFMKVVVGFSDTLPLMRGTFPHLKSHAQRSVVSEVMGPEYEYDSHNSEADVAALMAVLQKLKVSDDKFLEYSFTASSYAQHLKNLEEEKKMMDVLYSPWVVSKPTLEKLAMSGHTLDNLKILAECNNQEDFVDALHPVLPKRKTSVNLYEAIRKI